MEMNIKSRMPLIWPSINHVHVVINGRSERERRSGLFLNHLKDFFYLKNFRQHVIDSAESEFVEPLLNKNVCLVELFSLLDVGQLFFNF